MAQGMIYRTSLNYQLAMRALYGRHYQTRYRVVAELIPPNSSVLDLCCGPGSLYKRYLRHKSVDYLGIDINQRFIHQVKGMGAKALLQDLRGSNPLPKAEFVVMQASLYHFLPDALPILNRMRAAATLALIVTEPIHNLAKSSFGFLRKISASLTDVGTGPQENRFDEVTLDDLFEADGFTGSQKYLICGGREKLILVDTSSESPVITVPPSRSSVSPNVPKENSKHAII